MEEEEPPFDDMLAYLIANVPSDESGRRIGAVFRDIGFRYKKNGYATQTARGHHQRMEIASTNNRKPPGLLPGGEAGGYPMVIFGQKNANCLAEACGSSRGSSPH